MVLCVPAATNVQTCPIARNDQTDPVRVIGPAMATDLESEIAQATATARRSPIVLGQEHVPAWISVPIPVIDCRPTVAQTSTSAMSTSATTTSSTTKLAGRTSTTIESTRSTIVGKTEWPTSAIGPPSRHIDLIISIDGAIKFAEVGTTTVLDRIGGFDTHSGSVVGTTSIRIDITLTRIGGAHRPIQWSPTGSHQLRLRRRSRNRSTMTMAAKAT